MLKLEKAEHILSVLLVHPLPVPTRHDTILRSIMYIVVLATARRYFSIG